MAQQVSALVADIYTEFLEQTAAATVPSKYKPRLWKTYVNDILETVNKQVVEGLDST